MKAKFFVAAIAGIALAGCAKVEMTGTKDSSEKNLVTFASPVTSKTAATKANVYGEIGTVKYDGNSAIYTYPQEEDFTIFAVKHTGDIVSWDNAEETAFNGQNISYDSMVDSWAPKQDDGTYYYWPDAEKMSFAAMSPANLEQEDDFTDPTYGSSGLAISDFVIPSDPAKHFDLMFSERAANKTADNMNHTADSYSGIPLLFQHALTSIHFSLKTDNSVTEPIILQKIVLKNAKNKGSFKENIEEDSDASAYVVGTNVNPEWTVNEDSKATYTAFTGAVRFPYEAKYVSALAASDEDAEGENETSYPLLLMPQDLADDVEVDITYMVDTQVKTKTVQLNLFPNANPVTSWKIGYKYTYRLYYSKATELQDIISFGPSTQDWADGGIIEIQL